MWRQLAASRVTPEPGDTATANVQRKATAPGASGDAQAVGAAGVRGPGQPLPHLDAIQKAFGRHDVQSVRAHVGGEAKAAAEAMDAEAYATGNDVAFRKPPDLHTAAHEAAHVVQQRGGVQLKGGIDRVGDSYERHANTVADTVVRGESAELLLDTPPAGSLTTESAGVQRQATGARSASQAGGISSVFKPAESEESVSAPELRCDNAVNPDAPGCWMTSEQRSATRGEVNGRINAAMQNFLVACGKVSAELEQALKAEGELLELVVKVAFGLGVPGLSDVIMSGINRLPADAHPWMQKGARYVLRRPEIVKVPVGLLEENVKKGVQQRYTSDPLSFIESLENEASLWAQAVRGQVVGYDDDELLSAYSTWDARHTTIQHYAEGLRALVGRYLEQVHYLDRDVHPGATTLRRAVRIIGPGGVSRTALVMHRFDIHAPLCANVAEKVSPRKFTVGSRRARLA